MVAGVADEAQAREALSAYGRAEAPLTLVTLGHINRTYIAGAGHERRILQKVNPIFAPEVHEDIEAVTAHLEKKGLLTPRLLRTSRGELFTQDGSGGIWRMLTYVEGVIHARAEREELCRAAGALVGRFHVAVSDLQHVFRHKRPSLHDTPRHLQHLRDVLVSHAAHPSFGAVQEVGREILGLAEGLPSLAGAPRRITHNDLKITNVIFSEQGEALALIDLDTFAEMSIPVELGDALRSWCNASAEDAGVGSLQMGNFAAALDGYASTARALVSDADRRLLPHAVATIALELAARFAADALEESYFGWDRTRFARAAEHNLLRARTQLLLGKSAIAARPVMTEMVARYL